MTSNNWPNCAIARHCWPPTGWRTSEMWRKPLPAIAKAGADEGTPINAPGRPTRELRPLGGYARSVEGAPMTLAGKARTALRRAATVVDRIAHPKPLARPYFFASNGPPGIASDQPLVFGSCVCREAHYRLPLFRWWCDRLHEQPRYHRKLWEWVYICQTLHERGKLAPGLRGVGFGVGKEPLAALFASRGVDIVA